MYKWSSSVYEVYKLCFHRFYVAVGCGAGIAGLIMITLLLLCCCCCCKRYEY